ncbi:MAG: DMT family transporter [Candidatus Hodarchaeales archaeon]|jgi:drug/metabolite transporter (DMT)-like permease
MQDINRAQLAMLLSTFLWGLAPIFVEIALEYCTPLFIMTMRFGIAVLVMSIFLPEIKRRKGLFFLRNRTCILIGWLISFGYLTSTLGQDLTTAGLATLLSTSYIVMVPFMSWKFEKNRITRDVIALSCIALLGMFFITFNGDWKNFSNITSVGTLFLVIAAFLWGLNIVIADDFMFIMKSRTGGVDYLSFLYASIVHTFLPLFVLSFLESPPKQSVFLKILPLMIFLGVFTTILTFGLHQYALSKMGSVNTTFYLLLQILVPFSYEILILKMSYSVWVISGSLIILLTMMILETSALKRLANLIPKTSKKELQLVSLKINDY